MQNEKPIEELGLSTSSVTILKGKGVNDYGTLCCVTLGDLKAWGLEIEQIGEVVTMIKDG